MKHKILYIVSALAIVLVNNTFNQSYVTNRALPVGNRLGDQLCVLISAKFVAYKTGLPFILTPLDLTSNFMIYTIEKILTPQIQKQFNKVITIDIRSHSIAAYEAAKSPNESYLYRIWRGGSKEPCKPGVTLPTDQEFKKEMKMLLTPINFEPLVVPHNATTIAVHIRTGGGYDKLSVIRNPIYARKFLCDEFYAQRICTLLKEISEQNNQNVYIHIFTDDQCPPKITERIKSLVQKYSDLKCSVEWGCRKEGNRHDRNMEGDLYNMACFDYLIRPLDSNYSKVAQLIGNHKKVLVG